MVFNMIQPLPISMKIGELSGAAGLPLQTVRYYEKCDLLLASAA